MKKPYIDMPTIDLENVILRTIHISDYKDMYSYGRDPIVTKCLTWGPYVIEEEALDTIKHIFYPRIKEKLPIGYAIVDVKTSKMIGTIDFHSKIKKENGAEIGFVLHKDYWNQGIMSKCLNKMIDIGFNHLGYDFIRIKHLKKNIASQKVIEKTKFKLIDIQFYRYEKQKEVIEDELYVYLLTKEEYYGDH